MSVGWNGRERIPCGFDGKDEHVVADPLRTVDRERLVRHQALAVPQKMFAL
jgi:hypothetical protein